MKIKYKVIEVDDAEAYLGELFERKFNAKIPIDPKHFILQVEILCSWHSVGYVHYTEYANESYLCGGLVIDAEYYKKLDKVQRTQFMELGGFAEVILNESLLMLPNYKVIWGYVGDKLAEKVDLRVGFEHTHRKFIMAIWNFNFSNNERYNLVEEIYRLGPF